MKLRHILLTTDLSPEAKRAFEPVGDLAWLLGARVTLLHVLHVITEKPRDAQMGTPLGLPDYEAYEKTAEAGLQELAKLLPDDMDVSLMVRSGTNVGRTIARCAREQEVDLIAMSTHGRSGVRRLVLGSVAEEVLRRSTIPVLCYPHVEPDLTLERKPIQHILLTTDLSHHSLRPFEPVLALAKTLGCRVTVLHVVPALLAVPQGAPLAPPLCSADLAEEIDRAREHVAEQCAPLGDDVDLTTEVITHDEPAEGIVEYAQRNGADLIALSTHGRSGFARLALGSVAEDVLRSSPVPVLSFHRTEE
jgi:nucleotide-binding universal stress UspA family protein